MPSPHQTAKNNNHKGHDNLVAETAFPSTRKDEDTMEIAGIISLVTSLLPMAMKAIQGLFSAFTG